MGDFAYLYDPNFMHDNIIAQIVKLTGCKKYLELGIYDGYNISRIKPHCPYCVGVDIKDVRNTFNYNFILSSTDDFFKNNTDIFDIIFIDADHSFESAKKDFNNSLKILNKFGIIILHDTDPMTEFYAQPGYCGDSYKIINWIIENHPDLNVITLPVTQAGLTIVNRKKDRRVFEYLK